MSVGVVVKVRASAPGLTMVCCWEGRAFENQVRFYPDGLADGEAAEIVALTRAACRA